MAYGPERLGELADLALKHDLWVVSDDIYEKIVFDGFKFHNLPMLRPELAERTVIAHGLSKTYAMTGWRVGFMAGPEKVAQGVAKIQSQTTSNPCSISQKAGVAALSGPQDEVEHMRASFARRRDLVLRLLAGIPGLSCPRPQGAFYVLPDVSAYLGKKWNGRTLVDSEALADYLLEEAGAAIVPGSCFGDGKTIRFSYAISEADIERGLGRVKEALLKLA
jgi:aspartate aminotransferase